MQLILIPIAVAATILTYAASYHVLKTFTALGAPRLVATVVALLSGLSLLSLGDGVITIILIPYAALGWSLLLLLLLKWLGKRSENNCPLNPRPGPTDGLRGNILRPRRSKTPPTIHHRSTSKSKD